MTQGNVQDFSEHFSKEFLSAIQIVHLHETTSTSDVARERGETVGFAPTLVMADYQSRGHGQYERKWYSKPAKDVLATLAVPLDYPSGFPGSTDAFKVTTRLPIVLAAAVGKAVEDIAGLRVSFKWPNDILISGRKVGGVLVETHTFSLLIGVGINVNSRRSDYPKSIRNTVATLFEETGRVWERLAVAGAAISELFHFLSHYSLRAEDELMNYYLSRDSSRNRQMAVTVGGRKQVVTVRAINFADGSLDCLTSSGERTLVYSLGTWVDGE